MFLMNKMSISSTPVVDRSCSLCLFDGGVFVKKMKIIIGTLTLFLIISLYFNFKTELPIYSLNICIPFKDGGGYTVDSVIDTNNNKEAYLYLMNVLESYSNTAVDRGTLPPVPDLIITRNIPSMGITSGMYGIFFENELSYVIKGTKYEGQQIYQFDKESTSRILEATGYQL